ncbi:MAG: hypothetical protein NZ893_02930, partial [Candidatus Aenigmarchaeota archaeon]|nr:hypothetical protein [Candidatus Aenigmarchaeota archaeon]
MPTIEEISRKQSEKYIKYFQSQYPIDYVHIKRFYDTMLANGLSWSRITLYLRNLKVIKKVNPKPFINWTKDDVNQVAIWTNNQSYSEWTKFLILLTLRKFFQILNGYNWTDKKYPQIVDWLPVRINKTKLKRLSANDILSD